MNRFASAPTSAVAVSDAPTDDAVGAKLITHDPGECRRHRNSTNAKRRVGEGFEQEHASLARIVSEKC
jgi:hypothetical protein